MPSGNPPNPVSTTVKRVLVSSSSSMNVTSVLLSSTTGQKDNFACLSRADEFARD
jgi:hypothetical protein